MATLTLLTIRSLVRSDLNESTTTMLSDAEITAIANDGYRDTAVKGLCIESKIAKDAIAALKIIDLGATVIKVNYVEYLDEASVGTSGGVGILAISPQNVGYIPVTTGTPAGWFQWGRYLVVEPIPSGSTQSLAVYASIYPSAAMSADGDTPASLPVEFHECVYLYTLAFAALKLKRWADAANAYNRYIMDVQRKRQQYVMKYPDPRASHNIPDSVTMEESKRG
jgi:hypothetical protein